MKMPTTDMKLITKVAKHLKEIMDHVHRKKHAVK